MKIGQILLLLFFLSGCAQLYQVNITDIDNRGELRPFEIKVSELGFSIEEYSKISNVLLKGGAQNYSNTAANIYQLFQFGPTTGKRVFNDTYADILFYKILEQCPTGKITGLTSVRESRKYPVLSGEIVKIKGYCLSHKKNQNQIGANI